MGGLWTSKNSLFWEKKIAKNKWFPPYIFLSGVVVLTKIKKTNELIQKNTVFLSFLTRELDRTVNVPWPWFFKRFGPWSCTVWSFQTVHRSWPFLTVFDRFMIENAQERSGSVKNGQEHLGTIESERSNALERIVENGHGTVTLTRQKRKKHCIYHRRYIILAWEKIIF